VVLKERRRLVLLVRETPLSEVHLENMLKLARMGVVMLPPMPAFYNHPQSVDDVVNHIVGRVLDQFNSDAPFPKRWDGHMHTAANIAAVGGTTAKAEAVIPAGRMRYRNIAKRRLGRGASVGRRDTEVCPRGRPRASQPPHFIA
jgi:hypothetical protein